MTWQLSLRSLLPRRYETGKRYVEADEKRGDALRGNTVQADARAAYAGGDSEVAGSRSMSIQHVCKVSV